MEESWELTAVMRRPSHKRIPTLFNIVIVSLILSAFFIFVQLELSKNDAFAGSLVLSIVRLTSGFSVGLSFGATIFLVTMLWAKRKDKPLPVVGGLIRDLEDELEQIKKKMNETTAFSIFLPGGALDIAYESNNDAKDLLESEISRTSALGARYLLLAITTSVAGMWFVFSVSKSYNLETNSWVQPALSQLAIVGVLQILAIFFLRASASADRLRVRLVESVATTMKQRIAIALAAEDFIEGRSFARSIPSIVGLAGSRDYEADKFPLIEEKGIAPEILQKRLDFLMGKLND